MKIEFDISSELDKIIRKTASTCEGLRDDFDPQVRQADERFGDFQANGILSYAKKTGQNPRELAQRLIDALPESDLWETSIAGPGFINFVLSSAFYYQWIEKFGDSSKIRQAI